MSGPYAKVEAGCAYPKGNTAAHELGHALGLYHPHGTPDGTADPVEPLGSDCYDTAPNEGDYLCDTPPDPSKKYCVQDDCQMECEAPYEDYRPLVDNLMSYYFDDCQSPDTALTTEQANTLRCVFQEFYAKDMACPAGNCGSCVETCVDYACVQSCTWKYTFPTKRSCGADYCLEVESVSTTTTSVLITKADDSAFGSWNIMPWIRKGSTWIDNLYDCGPATGYYDIDGEISTSKLGLAKGGSVAIKGTLVVAPPGEGCMDDNHDTGTVTIAYECL